MTTVSGYPRVLPSVPAPPGGGGADDPQDFAPRRAERAVVISVIAVRLTFCAQLVLAMLPSAGMPGPPL